MFSGFRVQNRLIWKTSHASSLTSLPFLTPGPGPSGIHLRHPGAHTVGTRVLRMSKATGDKQCIRVKGPNELSTPSAPKVNLASR